MGGPATCRSTWPSSCTARRRDRVVALYPSPAGATESLVTPEAWEALVAENPVLRDFEPDVEALLVNRVGEARECYRVGIDECYKLVGLIRTHWRGLSGGHGGLGRDRPLLRRPEGRAIGGEPMPDLNFQVEGAEPQRFAAAPLLLFKLRVAEAVAAGAQPTPIHAVALRCQVRIEPARRRYDAAGEGAAPRPLRHAGALGPDAPADALDARQRRRPAVRRARPSSTCRCRAASTSAWRPRSTSPPWRAASSRSASSSAGRSSTRPTDGALQVAQISWEKEASFRLPAATWRGLMDLLLSQQRLALPAQGRLRPARPVSGAARACRPGKQALERLLAAAEEPVTP